ncbi:glycosyltransferase [Corynebacterium sp. UBA2622]|uniref:glycosyltransferase n=1 Tax=Corynebacterium sp. UBA2622 TaxID=1946393 RepID=UPI0025C68D28|nr:glycosyltransferase family 2 protein [Corynebacterium sp. UBA2622]
MTASSSRPSVALVIPCRNDAALLGRCLDSFARQSVPADAVVVVDNASSDHSAAVARSRGAVVVREPRVGITWAARAGYDAASDLGCDVILRTDADSIAPRDLVATLHSEWERAGLRPGREVVGLTGDATFDLPALSRPVSAFYLGSYRLAVGSALGHPPLFGTNCSFTTAWWRSVRDGIDSADVVSHDDIQLSFAVRPGETVLHRRGLHVRMDSRALRGRAQMRRRFTRGWHSMMRGFASSPPPRRLAQRLAWRLSRWRRDAARPR